MFVAASVLYKGKLNFRAEFEGLFFANSFIFFPLRKLILISHYRLFRSALNLAQSLFLFYFFVFFAQQYHNEINLQIMTMQRNCCLSDLTRRSFASSVISRKPSRAKANQANMAVALARKSVFTSSCAPAARISPQSALPVQ